MHLFVITLAALFLGCSCSPVPLDSDAAYSDPVCPGNIKNLWLDLMVVVDKSQLMTNDQLWQVRNTLTQVLGGISTIGPIKYPADPRSTCVGVVTYDENSTLNSQLDASKSFSDLFNVIQGALVSVDSTNSSYVTLGLLAAEKEFKAARSRTYRYSYKKVVVVFASDYQGTGTAMDPKPIANRLKDNTVTIITVACTKDANIRAAIQNLASPGFSLVDEMDTAKLVKQLTNALVSANCYCPKEFAQFTDNSTSTKYETCINGYIATGGSYGYQHAIDYCAGEQKGAHLANEFSKNKHDFILQTMTKDLSYTVSVMEYYIGLRYWNNQWMWEQPAGQPRIPLNPSIYSKWAPGWPPANSTDQVISVQPWSGTTEYLWASPQTNDWLFACEVQSASTEHFADFNMF